MTAASRPAGSIHQPPLAGVEAAAASAVGDGFRFEFGFELGFTFGAFRSAECLARSSGIQ